MAWSPWYERLNQNESAREVASFRTGVYTTTGDISVNKFRVRPFVISLVAGYLGARASGRIARRD